MTHAGSVGRKPRVICFIDSSNLYSYLRDAFGTGKYRQEGLCEAVTGPDRTLVQWRFYAAQLPDVVSDKQVANYESQHRFFGFICSRTKGFLSLGRFLAEDDPPHQTLREKGVDVKIGIDLVLLAAQDRYDVAVVMSGDEDLVPAVETARVHYGRRGEVALPTGADAYHMKEAADEFVEITRKRFDGVKLK